MSNSVATTNLACVGLMLLLLSGAAAQAELADVHLHDGLRLRGEVTRDGDTVILTNAAGELRLNVAEVERVIPVEPTPAEAEDAATEDVAEEEHEEAGAAELPGRDGQLMPAPPLSKEDIQKLRLHELFLTGPAERVQVEFERHGREQDLSMRVLEELKKRDDFRESWEQTLTRGQPHERLQLILRETGMKYADRIKIRSDPAVFAAFRRRVLPLVHRGCARSGCHAGTAARLFRFPLGSRNSETYAYTTFVLLDQMESRHGRLIDRDVPEDSVLVRYMLPPDSIENGHPDPGRGPSFKPMVRSRTDPNYALVVEWVQSLVVPHPDYNLDYENPYAGRVQPAEPAAEEPGEMVEDEPVDSE